MEVVASLIEGGYVTLGGFFLVSILLVRISYQIGKRDEEISSLHSSVREVKSAVADNDSNLNKLFSEVSELRGYIKGSEHEYDYKG